jgi:hypothetical protein
MNRILCAVASVILLITATFHYTGYEPIAGAVADSSLPEFFRDAIPGIWLFFSWHLTAIAAACAWLSWRGSSESRALLVFCAIVSCVDTVFVFTLAGLFAGTILLAAGALCLVIAAVRWTGRLT